MIEGLKRSARENSERSTDLKVQLEKVTREAEDYKKRLDDRTISAEKANNKIVQLEEEVLSTKRKLDRIGGIPGGGTKDVLLKEGYDGLRVRIALYNNSPSYQTPSMMRFTSIAYSPFLSLFVASSYLPHSARSLVVFAMTERRM